MLILRDLMPRSHPPAATAAIHDDGGICMALDIGVVFSSLVGLFLLLGVGILSVRLGVLSPSASAPLSSLLMQVTMPCTIVVSLLRPFDRSFLSDCLWLFVLGFVCFLSYGALSRVLARLFRVEAGNRGAWMISATYCNTGFMGYPVVAALFGQWAMPLNAVLCISYNVLIYSAGARMVCLDCPEPPPPANLRKVLLTPINAAVVLGLLCFIFQLSPPAVIRAPLEQLSNVTTPLSMFVTGMSLASANAGQVWRERDVLTACLTRLILFPGATLLLLRLIPFPSAIIPSLVVIIMAMPAPAVGVILAQTYGGNRTLCAKIVFLSSLLCIVTIPLFAILL